MILRPVAPPVEYGITKRLARAGNAAIALLRSLGTSAHVWLPGANGTTVASLPSNNYLLSDGSTGYSTVDGVDGLTLDGMGALGSELLAVQDLTTWSVTAGTPTINNATTVTYVGDGQITKAISTVAGRAYWLTIAGSKTGGSIIIYSNADQNSAGVIVNGTFGTYYFVAQATGFIGIRSGTAQTVTVTSISVKEYTGTHLTQPTTANKPLVRRGMLNLLRQSQALATTPWAARTGTIVATNNFAVGLDGTTTATKLDKTGVVDASWQQGTDTVMSASTPYTAVFILQKSVTTKIAEVVIRTVLGGIDYSSYVSFDTLSGAAYVRGDTGTPAVTVSVADASTYWVIALNKTSASGASADSNIIIRPYIGTTLGVFDATATGSCIVWRAGLFKGTWTAAQILAEGGIPTTTATAASNSSAGKYWWSFDGSNDSLLSGNLGITNACTIVIAGRVNSLAATQVVFDEDTNGVQAYITTAGAIYFAKPGVGNLVNTATGVIVAGVPFVVTVRLSSGTAVIRSLGVQVATSATAVTFSAITGARIGTAFNGTSNPTGGAIGWVVPIAAALSDADCLTVERLVSSQFPNGPVF